MLALTLILALGISPAAARGAAEDDAALLQGAVVSSALAAGAEDDAAEWVSESLASSGVVQKAHYGLSSIEAAAAKLWVTSDKCKKDLMHIALLEDEEDEHLPAILRAVSDALHSSLDDWTKLRATIEDSTSNISSALVQAGQAQGALKIKEAGDDAVGPIRSFILTLQEARDHAHDGQRRTKPGSSSAAAALQKIRLLSKILSSGVASMKPFAPKFEESFSLLAAADHQEQLPAQRASLLATGAELADVGEAHRALVATARAAHTVAEHVMRSAKLLVGGVFVATRLVAPETLL